MRQRFCPLWTAARQYDAACRIVAKWPLRCTRDDGVELLFAGVGHHPVADDAGVVHQHIETTEGLDRGLDQVLRAWFQSAMSDPLATASPPAAVISSTTRCAGAAAAGGRSVQTDTDVVDHDARTLGGEGQRVRATDAAARSGDDDDSAVDHAHIHCLLYLIALAFVVAR